MGDYVSTKKDVVVVSVRDGEEDGVFDRYK